LVESEDGDWVSANESLDMIMGLRKELEKLKQDNEYLKQLIERMDNRLGTY
jgi:cell division protein FtsB